MCRSLSCTVLQLEQAPSGHLLLPILQPVSKQSLKSQKRSASQPNLIFASAPKSPRASQKPKVSFEPQVQEISAPATVAASPTPSPATAKSQAPASFCTWLVDDSEGMRQEILQEHHVQVHSYSIKRMHDRGMVDRLLVKMHSIRPQLLWIRLLGPATWRGNKQDQKISLSIERLVSDQVTQGRHVLLESNENSGAWQLPGVQSVCLLQQSL